MSMCCKSQVKLIRFFYLTEQYNEMNRSAAFLWIYVTNLTVKTNQTEDILIISS